MKYNTTWETPTELTFEPYAHPHTLEQVRSACDKIGIVVNDDGSYYWKDNETLKRIAEQERQRRMEERQWFEKTLPCPRHGRILHRRNNNDEWICVQCEQSGVVIALTAAEACSLENPESCEACQ